MSAPSSALPAASAAPASRAHVHAVRAPGTPQINHSIPHHHANLSDSNITLQHMSLATGSAAGAPGAAGGAAAHHHASSLMSAPSRGGGAGLWAPSPAAAAAAAASALPAAATSSVGLVFPLVRPNHINDLSTVHADNSSVSRAAGSAWMASPASHLPPRTKIICTIGPASHSADKMRSMLMAGMNGQRQESRVRVCRVE